MCSRVRRNLELGRCPYPCTPPKPLQRPGLSIHSPDSRFLGALSSPGSFLALRHPINSPGAAGVLGVCGAAAGTPTYLNPSGWRHQPTSPPHPIQRKLFLRLQLSSGEIQHLPSLDSLPDGVSGVSSFPQHQGSQGSLVGETSPPVGGDPPWQGSPLASSSNHKDNMNTRIGEVMEVYQYGYAEELASL